MTTLPREAYAGTTEKAWQAQVVRLARLYSWRVFHAWTSIHSPAGLPDLTLIRPPRLIYTEVKSPKGKLSTAQAETIVLLRQCPGVECYVWWPWDIDTVMEVLR